MRRRRWEGVKLKRGRIYALADTDDIILVAEEEERMRCMMRQLEGYLRRKELELNVGKSKVMKFKKEEGR